MEKTPLYQALKSYAQKDYARFHMPGHKGAPLPPIGELSSLDLTEIEGTDSLFEEGQPNPGCPIKQLEQIFTGLYETKRTVISASGSSLCIQAMLTLAARKGKKLAAGRNIHTSAVNAMALLDLDPVWIYPDRRGERLIGRLEAAQVKAVLEQEPEIAAVYLTSPDYFGVQSEIGEIAALCHRHGIPLLVDNAHGAHLKWFPPDFQADRHGANRTQRGSLHPMDLGADLCCDSLHKTLPALTGAALLHCGNPEFAEELKGAMSLFASTSPSYLIMLSCDAAAAFLQGDGPERLRQTAERCGQIRSLAKEKGFTLPEYCDPMRITLPLAGTEFTAEPFRLLLRQHGIMEEYLSDSGCVLLASPFNREEDFKRLESLLDGIRAEQNAPKPYPMFQPERACGLREAVFAPRETVPIGQAAGRTAVQVKSPCPPGIPLIMPGEILHKDAIKILKLYGIFSIDVLK